MAPPRPSKPAYQRQTSCLSDDVFDNNLTASSSSLSRQSMEAKHTIDRIYDVPKSAKVALPPMCLSEQGLPVHMYVNAARKALPALPNEEGEGECFTEVKATNTSPLAKQALSVKVPLSSMSSAANKQPITAQPYADMSQSSSPRCTPYIVMSGRVRGSPDSNSQPLYDTAPAPRPVLPDQSSQSVSQSMGKSAGCAPLRLSNISRLNFPLPPPSLFLH